ncbi:hypothetical protein EGW08_017369, partial [Elysia chlorotica]
MASWKKDPSGLGPRLGSGTGRDPQVDGACQYVVLPSELACWPAVKEMLSELQGRLINENITDQETAWFFHVIYSAVQREESPLVRSEAKAAKSASAATKRKPGTAAGQQSSEQSVRVEVQRLRSELQACVKKKPGQSCVWAGLLKYVKELSKDDADGFMYNLLPRVIEMALGIEESAPQGGLRLSHQQAGEETKLSRQFVCSVVACCFLCLFPERKRWNRSKLNTFNFTTFFKHLPSPPQVGKLECILCYFECVVKRGMEMSGDIVLS